MYGMKDTRGFRFIYLIRIFFTTDETLLLTKTKNDSDRKIYFLLALTKAISISI